MRKLMTRAFAVRRLFLTISSIGLFALVLAHPSIVLSKDFPVLGTVECGLASGQQCLIGDALTVWTLSLSGMRDQATIDVAWVRAQLEEVGTKQDDLICLHVEEVPGGGLRALSIPERCEDVDEPKEEKEKEERDHPSNNL